MKDRISLYPGRVKLTPVAGEENTFDMVRADQPTQEGTALSKATLLSDETAAALGLDEDATVDEALKKVSDQYKVGDTLTTARTDLGDKWALCNGDLVSSSLEISQILPAAEFENQTSWAKFGDGIQDGMKPNKSLAYKGDLFFVEKSTENKKRSVLKCLRGKSDLEEIEIPLDEDESTTAPGNITFDKITKKILYAGQDSTQNNAVTIFEISPETLKIESKTKTTLTVSSYYGVYPAPIVFHVGSGYWIFKNTNNSNWNNGSPGYYAKTLTASSWNLKSADFGYLSFPTSSYGPLEYFQTDDGGTLYLALAVKSGTSSSDGRLVFLYGDGYVASMSSGIDAIGHAMCYDQQTQYLYSWYFSNPSAYGTVLGKISNLKNRTFISQASNSTLILANAIKRENGKTLFLNDGELRESTDTSSNGLNTASYNTLKKGFEYTAGRGRTIIDQYDNSFFGYYYQGFVFPAQKLPAVTNPDNLYTYIRVKE